MKEGWRNGKTDCDQICILFLCYLSPLFWAIFCWKGRPEKGGSWLGDQEISDFLTDSAAVGRTPALASEEEIKQ